MVSKFVFCIAIFVSQLTLAQQGMSGSPYLQPPEVSQYRNSPAPNRIRVIQLAGTFEQIAIERGNCFAASFNTRVCTIATLNDGKSLEIGPVHCLEPVAKAYGVTVDALMSKMEQLIKSACPQ